MAGPSPALDPVIAADIGQLAPPVEAFGRRIEATAPLALNWPRLLGERAALDRLPAPSRVSSGGATRLLRCADGWIAVSLARPSDADLVPAWLDLATPEVGVRTRARAVVRTPTPWLASPDGRDADEPDDLEAAVGHCRGDALVDAAALVGLPVGRLGERAADADGGVGRTTFGPRPPRRRRIHVVDLSSLWAGPLCGSLLATSGTHVTKVESTSRPDGARVGSPAFFERLNGGKEQIALDLTAPAGRAELTGLIIDADVVIESARPRALEQFGIVAADLLAADDGPDVWVSITGHGRSSPRVAFGDDAAVAGGLVCSNRRPVAVSAHERALGGDGDGPRFVADAIADPLAGLAACAATFEALRGPDRVLLDVSMAGVAATVAATLPPPPAP